MRPITIQYVEAVFNRYVRACQELGLVPPDSSVVLTNGSISSGRAFRVNTVPNDSSGYSRPPAGTDFLGFTKREAFNVLADRSSVLEDVLYNLRGE